MVAAEHRAQTLPAITDGALSAYFIWEVSDTIDLEQISQKASFAFERAQLNTRALASPSYIAFPVPPISIPLPDSELCGRPAKARVKLYEYGVVSVRIDVAFSGLWQDYKQLAHSFRNPEELTALARKLYKTIEPHLLPVLRNPRESTFFEDYYVFTVHEFAEPVLSNELLSSHRVEVAALVRGEHRTLSNQEIDESLRQHLSYFDNDLTVLEWDSAFVYDRTDAADTIHNILEFANTQLVELRTYDKRLDAELDWIYATDPVHNQRRGPFSQRAAGQRAQRLRLMLVDIRELVDRTNNALKIIGDAFYARVYRSIRSRLGLSDWEKQIDEKLESVNLIYHFLTDQAQHLRNEVLEWIVILLIFVEVIMGFIRH